MFQPLNKELQFCHKFIDSENTGYTATKQPMHLDPTIMIDVLL